MAAVAANMKSERVMPEKLSRLGCFNKRGNAWNTVGRGE